MQIFTLQEKLKNEIQSLINELFGIENVSVQLDIPTDKTKSDLVSNVSFVLAKEVKKSAFDIAKQIVEKLNENKNLIDYFSFEAAGVGFINIFFSDKFLNILLEDIDTLGFNYGKNDSLINQTWVIEHTSPNPNKAMHIGHLRNNLIGMAISNICEASGAKVIREAIDNNRGIAIAKAMWGYLIFKKKDGQRIEDVDYWISHQDEWLDPNEIGIKPDHFIGDCYLLGNEDFKNNPESEKKVRNIVVLWENENKNVWKLWEKVLDYVHSGILETLNRLGNKWDKVWHEHEHYKEGKDLISQGLEKQIFKKLEDGAVLTNLEKYNIPDTILLKSDGTSLYITQDIALTKLKKKKYDADKLIWVIGPEQSLAMKQVFACCEQLGIGKLEDFVHISYGLVNILGEDGEVKKMSSRGGEMILIDELIDETKKVLMQTDRGYDDKLAEEIAIGAIKYSILKSSRNSNIVINLQNATNLTGDSGVYILYTYARMNSLLSKANSKASESALFSEKEKKVVAQMSHWPIIMQKSLNDFAPNLIVEYLLELAQVFNALYAEEKFISDDEETTGQKIFMIKSLHQVFSNALDVIGIKAPDKI
jgi:arginyl-tRNA synthetase